MSGWTNCVTGGDPAVEACFLASAAVETTADPSTLSADAMAIAQPSIDRKSESDVVDANATDAIAAEPSANANSDSWRRELTARLERYRTRRKPRTPRYPSLLLPFDSPEGWSRTASAGGPGTAELAASLAGMEFVSPSNLATAEVSERDFAELPELSKPNLVPTSEPTCDQRRDHDAESRHYLYSDQAPEPSGRVIAFPRSAAIPVFRASGLADPVFDHTRPRIVEAPEILPPPPALGGMLIEPAHREPIDLRSGESPSSSASIARRLLAALIDGTILAMALAAFATIFLHLNPNLSPSPNLFLNLSLRLVRESLPLLAGLGGIAIALWAAYEFLFVVYTGSTPGLRATRLRMASFDGSPLSHRSRRWRVLASLLSALSMGLGYLWCLLDQDGLCWHDRITRTHVRGA